MSDPDMDWSEFAMVAEHRIREWEGTLRGEDVKADVVGDKAQQLGLFE